MKLKLDIDPDIVAMMAAEVAAGERAVTAAMREALPVFGRQIPGYDHPDVVMTGVETRTSSPVRFTRGADFQSLNTVGLFPAGEGAGYAAESCRRQWMASRWPKR